MPGSKGDHPTRKLNRNLGKILNGLRSLKDINVSYHLVIHMEGRTQVHGTPNACRVFDVHKDELENALVDDAIELCGNKVDEGALEETETPAKEQAFVLKHGLGLQRLPYPLKLMNRKENLVYCRYLIQYDRTERLGNNSDRIVAGDESWEPRFWPKDVKKWREITTNIALLKSEHLDGETPTSVFTKLIKSAFHMFGKHVEEFFSENMPIMKTS